MKKSEIKIGKTYSNGRGRARKVIDMGPQYKLYAGQIDTDTLLYEIVKDGTKGNLKAGHRGNTSVASFASWAKEAVDTDAD